MSIILIMFAILIIVSTIVLTSALEPVNNVELADEKIRGIISKYISNIPDIKEQYVVDERISKAISHYFNGKISSFPLYKISVKIDRNPVKIPWTLGEPEVFKTKTKPVQKHKNKHVQKLYKLNKVKNNNNQVKNTTKELDESKETDVTNLPETTGA